MILDEIADVLESECKSSSLRKVSKTTGIPKSTLSSIINGCGFNINLNFIAGLSALGYELTLTKKQSKHDL